MGPQGRDGAQQGERGQGERVDSQAKRQACRRWSGGPRRGAPARRNANHVRLGRGRGRGGGQSAKTPARPPARGWEDKRREKDQRVGKDKVATGKRK